MAGGGPGNPGSGDYVLVQEVILAADAGQIEFSGINGDVDLEYVAVFDLVLWGLGFSAYWFVNGGQSVTARSDGTIFESGAGAPSGFTFTDGRWISTAAGYQFGRMEVSLTANRANGRLGIANFAFGAYTVAANIGNLNGIVDLNLGANLTSFGLFALANVFLAGSKAYLYKRKT